MSQQTTPREYPNVKARLRLSRMAPALPSRESYMDIWMKGTRFRVRDESGRDVASILGDLSSNRGLGAPARSIEEMMDIWSQSQDTGSAARGATELYGDRATGEGWVLRGGQPAWPIQADVLAPAAEQILAGEPDKQAQPPVQVTRLGRQATEYHGFLEGEDRGIQYKSEVTRIVSPPYLLLIEVRNAQSADHYYTREVVSLDEGVVTDSDLIPA
jgi:hypothetical protein